MADATLAAAAPCASAISTRTAVADGARDRTGTTRERNAVATQAAYEIEAIARLLQDLEHTCENELVMRGLFLRLEDLSGVVMSVTGTEDDRELASMRAVVYGRRLAYSAGGDSEASHA